MSYDPRAPFGHQSSQHQQPPGQPDPYLATILNKIDQQRPPLTFGQVFWACFLALLTWGILAYLVIAQLIEEAENGF